MRLRARLHRLEHNLPLRLAVGRQGMSGQLAYQTAPVPVIEKVEAAGDSLGDGRWRPVR